MNKSIWRRLVVDAFWNDWHERFKRQKDIYIRPDDQEVRLALSEFEWNRSMTDREKAIAAWKYVTSNTQYKLSEYWKKPAETLNSGIGDCEDFTFLLASMFCAMGVREHSVKTGVLILPGKKPEEHTWNNVDGMVVDGTAMPDEIAGLEYRPNKDFQIKTNNNG
jgi:hypothetical protein